MQTKSYQRDDVSVFNQILRKKFCPNDDSGASKKVLLEMVQRINKKEIKFKGLEIDKKEEQNKINILEYGYKESSDVKFEFVQDVFENKSKIILIPKKIYELEDKIELPYPPSHKAKLYLDFLSDTFERLKIKAVNVVRETHDTNNIELYAKKNIQMAQRIFYDARMVLNKTQIKGDRNIIFLVFAQNVFIINVILFYQNMFSSFYNEKKMTKKSLKAELYDSVGMNIMMEPVAKYGNAPKEEKNIDAGFKPIKWNGQINTLITYHYDFMNERLINKKTYFEASIEEMAEFIHRSFIDKNGNPINKNTIRICLQDYRDDKRVKGKKRIDISKYVLMEE